VALLDRTQHYRYVVFSEKKPAVLNTKTERLSPKTTSRIWLAFFALRICMYIMPRTNKIWRVFVRPGAYCPLDLTRRKDFWGWERIIFRHNTEHTHNIIRRFRYILTKAVVDQLLRDTQFLCRSYGPRDPRVVSTKRYNNGVLRTTRSSVLFSYCCAIVRICTGPTSRGFPPVRLQIIIYTKI